jgi:hypothetical protein
MAKKNKITQKSKAKPKQRQAMSGIQRVRQGLDAAARDYAELLKDPCNGRLVPPVYNGMGTGEYRRYRRILYIPATAVEGTYVFCPGRDLMNSATHIAANAGTPYQFVNQADLFGLKPASFGDNAELRCLAACVKIRYTGPESERGGVVGLRTLPFNYVRYGDDSDNATQLSMSPSIHRTGEVDHEVKFVPGSADQVFSIAGSTPSVEDTTRGMFGFTFSLPASQAGALQVEVTAVLEVEAPKGVVPTAMPASSGSTLNQVLSALGPTARWAYGNIALPVIKSAVGQVTQSFTKTGAVSAGLAMLTL